MSNKVESISPIQFYVYDSDSEGKIKLVVSNTRLSLLNKYYSSHYTYDSSDVYIYRGEDHQIKLAIPDVTGKYGQEHLGQTVWLELTQSEPPTALVKGVPPLSTLSIEDHGSCVRDITNN